MTTHYTLHHHRLLFLSLSLALFLTIPLSDAREKRDWLFYDLPEGENADPIVEYHEDHDGTPERMPPFLDKSVRDHRVVMFYSPQCPHCIHFAPQYIEFARYWTNLTLDPESLYSGLEVKFYAVSCISYKKVCRKQKANSYPTLKAFSGKEDSKETVFQGQELHPLTLLKAIGEGLVKDEWLKQGEPQPDDNPNIATANYFTPRTHAEIYGDAYLTFYHAMKDSIFLEDGPLPQKRGQAIKQWLRMLTKALPPWRMNWPVQEVLDDFKESAVSERQWTSLVEMFPPQQSEWTPACRQHASPYTCGLWTFFHIVTVGVVEYNRQILPHDRAIARKAQNVNSVAIMLREYVHHFFLCEECSTHFVQAFDNCDYNRCHRIPNEPDTTLAAWRELPLWLLDVHNGVNVRLQLERFEREGRSAPATVEEEQAVMWPPVDDCPMCWSRVAGAKSLHDNAVMYNYLRMVYWPEDGETRTFKRQLASAIDEYKRNPQAHMKAQASRRAEQQGSSTLTADAITLDSPYVLITAFVCGIWIVVLWKKIQMDQILGIQRSKERTS